MHRGMWTILCLLLCASGASADPGVAPTELLDEYGPVRVGDASPSFAGWDVDGQLVTLDGLFEPDTQAPQAVVITFFATWCGPCKEGLPKFQALADPARGRHVKVVGISVGEDADTVTPFLEELGLAIPTITDPFGTISKKFGLGGPEAQGSLPRTFILDQDRKIRCIIGVEGDDLLGVLEREVAFARREANP